MGPCDGNKCLPYSLTRQAPSCLTAPKGQRIECGQCPAHFRYCLVTLPFLAAASDKQHATRRQAQGGPGFSILSLKLQTAPTLGWQAPLLNTVQPAQRLGPKPPKRSHQWPGYCSHRPRWVLWDMRLARGQTRPKTIQNGATPPCGPCPAGPMHLPGQMTCRWEVWARRGPLCDMGLSVAHAGPF